MLNSGELNGCCMQGGCLLAKPTEEERPTPETSGYKFGLKCLDTRGTTPCRSNVQMIVPGGG